MKKNLQLLIICSLISSGGWAQQLIPDSLFGVNGLLMLNIGEGQTHTKLLMQPDGKIITGGYDYDINQNDFHNDFARFDVCGILDSSFGVNGAVHHKFSQRNFANDYNLQADGKILCCGTQAPSNAGSQQVPFVARYNSDGTTDTNFASSGSCEIRFDPVSSGTFYSVYQLPDTRILCIGRSSGNINGGTNGFGAMRFLSGGSLDTSFNSDGITRYDINVASPVGKGFILPDQKIIAAGTTYDVSFNAHFTVVCFDSTGTLDTTFATNGVWLDAGVIVDNDMVADKQPDDKIVLAAFKNTTTDTIEVIRLTPAGIPDPLFGINGRISFSYPSTYLLKGLQVMSNNQIMIMGATLSNGMAVLLNNDGSIDSSFGTNGLLTLLLNPAGTCVAGSVIELSNGQLLFAGDGYPDFQHGRLILISNVPHITQNLNQLQTTGTGSYQWYLNGVSIAGASFNSYTFTQNGSYTVLLTDTFGCSLMSEPFVVNNVSVQQINQHDFIFIAPNPVSAELLIRSSEKIDKIKIMDLLGNEIYNETIKATLNFKLQTLNFQQGVYFIEIMTGDKRSVAKFMKVD